MMKSLEPLPRSNSFKTILQKALDAIRRAVNTVLNAIFSPAYNASEIRARALVVSLIVAYMLAVWMDIPADAWREAWANLFVAFVNPVNAPVPLSTALISLVFGILLHPIIWRHMLTLYAPFWLMQRVAAIYLADIFEKDEAVAHTFLMQAAFGHTSVFSAPFEHNYNAIHIRQGKVDEPDHNSPILQIGGPGKIVVELDSAVLFEKPDGAADVIDPPSKGNIVDDFERIRRVVDLRDIVDTVDLPAARSKDGIIIGAKDIQFSYSIYRGENPNRDDLKNPYPVSKSAIERLTYGETRAVKPGEAPKSSPEWQSGIFKINGAILGDLGSFIAKRSLTEFLASIGEPEEAALYLSEKEIDRTAQLISDRNGNRASDPPLKAGAFPSRELLTNSFYDPEKQKQLADKGFQLNWIGVGTWKTSDAIRDNHLEAWKNSRENIARGNPGVLKGLRNDSKLAEFLRLIRMVPINRFYYDHNLGDDERAENLLNEYREILQEAVESYTRGGLPLDRRYEGLMREADELASNNDYTQFPLYRSFLQDFRYRFSQSPFIFSDVSYEDFLRRAQDLHDTLAQKLLPTDVAFLKKAIELYTDVKKYRQIQKAIDSINRATHPPYHQVP